MGQNISEYAAHAQGEQTRVMPLPYGERQMKPYITEEGHKAQLEYMTKTFHIISKVGEIK